MTTTWLSTFLGPLLLGYISIPSRFVIGSHSFYAYGIVCFDGAYMQVHEGGAAIQYFGLELILAKHEASMNVIRKRPESDDS